MQLSAQMLKQKVIFEILMGTSRFPGTLRYQVTAHTDLTVKFNHSCIDLRDDDQIDTKSTRNR